ncbi:MAG: carboxypeptidase M32 [Clostridia bacterium]|nr:carboxypeptidase M32 [Clostridia bacterium]
MTLQEAIVKLNELEASLRVLDHAMGVLSLDGNTAAPRNAAAGRGQTMAALGGMYHEKMIAPQTREILETILAHKDECDQRTRRQAEVLKENVDDLTRIPVEEYMDYSMLTNEAESVWHDAKEKSDYASFAPYLEKLIAYNRRFASYKDATKPAYEVLLDSFEKGTSTATLDPFFALLRTELTPVILDVAKRPEPRMDFLRASYPVAQQRIFSDRLMDMMGIDRGDCNIAETEHPFTTSFGKHDTRITTHYYERDVASNMFSVIHEGGHAIYDMGYDDALEGTCLAGGATMGIHESQSRFYENLIGRSRPFCEALLPVMRECFPEQMAGVTAEELYQAVNYARPSLIRIEADELTYGMHVMVRYEMEKRMIAGDMSVKDIPGEWNRMYKEYLGVDVPDDRRGVLQDSHWAGSAFGYFPSYALGSAYGVQMLRAMEKEIDVWTKVAQGDMTHITAWLRENVHKHGRLLLPGDILEGACRGPFDPHFYVDYLKEKYA